MSRIAVVAALVLGVASEALAQNPPAGAPPAPQGRGGRGGGRGRGRAVSLMTLTSTSVTDGAAMPTRNSQAGEELSPPLTWSGAPDSTQSFVLIMHDLDGGLGVNGTEDFLHWMVWNIPATTKSLPEGVPHGPQKMDGSRQISASGPYYRGPAAPATGPVHHYVFELFAVDTVLDVPAVGAAPAAARAAVIAAMAGHVRGKGVLTALYRRGP